ncbi:hypothetical protein GWI33_011190, partial [Rhynchophorus ferrugineus]
MEPIVRTRGNRQRRPLVLRSPGAVPSCQNERTTTIAERFSGPEDRCLIDDAVRPPRLDNAFLLRQVEWMADWSGKRG